MAAAGENWASNYVQETCDDILRLLSHGQAWLPFSFISYRLIRCTPQILNSEISQILPKSANLIITPNTQGLNPEPQTPYN